ncbi:Glycosyltransferase involved in cell wall bisynthesis [Zobellia uliginosa]|uniref:Glycosyltransferase involved in cell wall bisynthesis n=1 Tax=Zobellia uliginosa TaxID=143224 RepID=A0ABY1KJT3_9FLAO|nr:glycosyltransferase [Zobellia uliginosa]SIS42620.1 Glycosyltransferase involved in cell wall bisynthesis [Zobellia uliginosa]
MKILRVIASMNPKQGGPCQGIRNAIPELLKLGVENEVVCFDELDADYLGKDSFKIYAIGGAKNPWRYNSKLIPWLLNNFAGYDAVIVHGLWQYHSHAAIKAMRVYRKSKKASPKIYIMPHGMLDPYFQKAKERRLKALRNEVYWRLFENKVVNGADGILFTCEEELLLARTAFANYNPKKEINAGYGIQPPPHNNPNNKKAFAEKVPKWKGEPFFLFLSRIHQKKGVDLLIKAYLRLEKELSELPQLIIAGPVDHAYGHEILKLGETSENILFTGMLTGAAKWGAFYESEAFVLPSHQENFGIAVVEALACKKPVLISNKVNIWREIEKEKGGIVKNDNEEETYELLKKWLSFSEVEKSKMAINAIKVYQEYFTIAQAARQFLKGINP